MSTKALAATNKTCDKQYEVRGEEMQRCSSREPQHAVGEERQD